MKKEFTLQQAIFHLSNLHRERGELMNRLSREFVGPVAINGKRVLTKEKEEGAREILERVLLIQADIIALRRAMTQANLQTKAGEQSLCEALESARLNRELVDHLDGMLQSRRTDLENSVGVVDYAPYDAAYLETLRRQLFSENNERSNAIDRVNANTTLVVEIQYEL